MKWVGQAILYLGLYIIWSGTFGQPNARFGGIDWSIAVPFGLLGIAVLAAGAAITNSAMTKTQEEEDEISRTTLESPNPGTAFSLFLRPFDTTGKLKIEKAPGNLFSWEQYDRPGIDALERMLADAVADTARLIGLGTRGDVEFGPGTAGFVADWKSKVEQAAQSASYIFVVPSANEGTLWEIGLIKQRGYFAKSVFIMPPTVPPFKFDGVGEYKEVWKLARLACRSAHQIELPIYDSGGCMFLIDGSAVVRKEPFDGFTPRDVAKAINKLVQK